MSEETRKRGTSVLSLMVIKNGDRVCLPSMQKSQFLGLNLTPSCRSRSFEG